jgi:hypothetical protein
MATRKNRPPRNRRKSVRYRAAKKARVKRKFKKSPHGKKMSAKRTRS